ncbi:MAG: hypothetical protein ACREEE_17720 [Dongiaceae bacterium]
MKLMFPRTIRVAFALALLQLTGVGFTSTAFADDVDCSNPRQPVKNALATALETAVRTCGCGINISHTLCSRHGDSEAHADGRAMDISQVDGEKVGSDNEAARRLQQIFHDMSPIEENLGPFFRERRNADGNMTPVEVESGAYQDFIHISVAP